MNRLPLANLLLAAAMMTMTGACSNNDASSSDPAVDETSSENGNDGAEGEGDSADAAVDAPLDEPEASASNKRRERNPFEEGQRRTVSFKDAADKLQFTAFEPTGMPKGAMRTVVHSLELIEGVDNALLPGMRMIYDLEGNGAVILTQGNAIGDIGEEGEAIEVSGVPARLIEDGESLVLIFERDGVHLELRTNALDRAAVLALAEGLTPYDQIVEGDETEADAPEADGADDATGGDDSDAADEEASDDASSEEEESGSDG